MTKTRIRPITELGLPKARVVPKIPVEPEYIKPQFPKDSNESEKETSENRTPIVKQNHTEKYKRTKPSER